MENEQEVDEVQKRRLMKRIALALAILAGLAGSLAVFDRMHAPEPAVVAKLAVSPSTETVAVAPQSAPPPEAKKEEVLPVHTAAVDAPPLPAVADEKPLTRPAIGRLVALEAAGNGSFSDMRPEQSPATIGSANVAAVRERSAPTSGEAAQRPLALQVGVFSKVTNAEELLAKLERNGIPASIEARVHVGPFATRAEADAARLKLKELGMKDSLLITRKSRPPT